MDPDQLLARGVRLGGYEIVEPLGAGGMGAVYRAYDPRLNRLVALKVLNPGAVGSGAPLRRLEQEARAASALNHPGIVTIHDTGESEGRFYIVMELVEGTTLRQFLRRGPRPLRKALHIATQLAEALAKAHEAGVVHRDLKPENVMVTPDEHVKIVDFGLAKLTDRSALFKSEQDSATESGQGVIRGTVGYMAPEQVRGEPADARADQFAFGAILYELLSGSRAFQRSTSVETLSMILNEDPPEDTVITALPSSLRWLLDRCLAKDARDRYASTRDLALDLIALRDHSAELLRVDKRRVVNPLAWATAGIFAAALVAAGYLAARTVSPGASAEAGAPRFKQVTFGRGHVVSARFAPDGKTILYSASWGGAPVQSYETRLTGPESRPLGPAGSSVASISSKGELALILGCRLDWANCVGTLAQMPQDGGVPREIMEDVLSADWSADGQTLAAIRTANGLYQLDYPPGTTLYRTASKLGYLRFSPRGDRIAFLEYEEISAEQGVLKIIDLQGRVQSIGSGWDQIRDIAWTADGTEIWVSAGERARIASIYAVSMSGTRRLVFDVPGALFLQDLSRDGRALVAHGLARGNMVWSSAAEQRDLTWLDWSTVADLSRDGKRILFYEWGEAVSANPVVYLRTLDGADAVRLGDGRALALSPNGRWALALQESPQPHLVLLPTGVGVSRELSAQGLADIYWARWFPDGERLLIVGEDADRTPGSYVQRIETGALEPIAEKGLLAVLVAPDGRSVLVNDPLEGYIIWPLDNTPPRALQSLSPEYRPIQWSEDGRFLYVRDSELSTVQILRFDIATGRTALVKQLKPADPAGVVGIADGRGELAMTPDGETYLFTYWTFLRNLYLVEGLSP